MVVQYDRLLFESIGLFFVLCILLKEVQTGQRNQLMLQRTAITYSTNYKREQRLSFKITFNMKSQSDKAKKGEVKFRKKLFQQQVEGKAVFGDEYDAKGIEKILAERMKRTLEQMTLLKEKGVVLSPYLEIGAERCQRSLVMENNLGANGAAVDISYDMLKSCDYYKRVFNKDRVPLRICCDANNLPFMSDSIPFVFCYETLHHFPDPFPIVKEIYRVLSPGGHFFFDEEPYKKVLHLNVYNDKKLYSKESVSSGKIRRILDHFLARRSCNEVEHQIVENDEITIGNWRRALALFEEKNITLQSSLKKGIISDLFCPENYLNFFLAYLLGGGISGVCGKSGSYFKKKFSIQDVFICPSCAEKGREFRLDQRNSLFFAAIAATLIRCLMVLCFCFLMRN